MNHDVTYRLAMDRISRLQAEAEAERLAHPERSRRRSIGGWEGRPARRPPSRRILAWVPRRPARAATVILGRRLSGGEPHVDGCRDPSLP